MRMVPTVRHLRLVLRGQVFVALPSVAALRNLVSLQLVIWGPDSIDESQLGVLGNISTLEALEVLSSERRPVTRLSVGSMPMWVSRLPLLRRFVVGIGPGFTADALVTLGTHCRFLQFVSLRSTISLHDLETSVRDSSDNTGGTSAAAAAAAAAAPTTFRSAEYRKNADFVVFPELKQLLVYSPVSRGHMEEDSDIEKIGLGSLSAFARHAPKLELLQLPRESPVGEAVNDI
jgi:hypothetical protein